MKKILLLLLAAALLLTGCSGGKSDNPSGMDLEKLAASGYPIDTDITLKYWIQQGPSTGQYKDRNDYPYTKNLEDRVGVKFEWISPAIGQEVQQFNIMIASGDMPDIIEWYWGDFSGGPDKAIDEGYIARLNDLIDKYSPNFKKLLQSDEYYDKRSKTDQGNYYYYPGLAQYGGDNDRLLVTAGYMFRKDWLDELGLQVPETIDDWYNVLTAFKEKKGAESPLCISAGNASRGLSGGFNASMSWYQEDGVVKYGYVQPEFKDFLATMRKWYDEGLLDKNITNIDSKTVDAKLLNDQAGAVFGWIGSNMGKWLAAANEVNPNFDLIGVPYPVKNRGDRPKFVTKDAVVYVGGAAIGATSKYKELAAKVLDYGYSEEGHMFMNFGVEGETYNLVDGYPKYSELITNNPEGLTFEEALRVNVRATGRGPYVQDVRYIEQRYALPQQKTAQANWIDTDVDKYALPALTPTSDESAEFSKIMNDIKTYVDEMYLKFIIGKEPIEKFDEFVQQIYSLGLDRAIEIQQAALDRFNAR